MTKKILIFSFGGVFLLVSSLQAASDTTAPIISIDPYPTDWTNQDVTVTASSNEGVLNTSSHTFSENATFDFVARDAAGNTSTSSVEISHIDKVDPLIDLVDPTTVGEVNSDVAITVNVLDYDSYAYEACIWLYDGSSSLAIAEANCMPLDDHDGEDDDEPIWTWMWNTLDLADGDYQLYATVVDTAGNYVETDKIDLAINNYSLGSESEPAEISSCEDLQAINDHLNWYYELSQDIDCSDSLTWNGGQGFAPIGGASNDFVGVLNGYDFNVSNLYQNQIGFNSGIFQAFGINASVSNINFLDINIFCNSSDCGTLAYANRGSLENSSISGSLSCTGNCGDFFAQNSGEIKSSLANITITERDLVAPIISLLGEASTTLYLNDIYTDAGATATDDVDGDLSLAIVTASNLDSSQLGTYVITYNVMDSSMNQAIEVQRSVTVLEAPQGSSGGARVYPSKPAPTTFQTYNPISGELTVASSSPAATSSTETKEEDDTIVLGTKIDLTELDSLFEQNQDIVEAVSSKEASEILGYSDELILSDVNKLFFEDIVSLAKTDQSQKDAIRFFIQFGTKTTKSLGSGERAGIIHSFFSAFAYLPKSLEDWQDIIRIANGHAPKQSSQEAEAKAKAQKTFFDIFDREADTQITADQKAIDMLAYGLRPKTRSLEKELKALEIFQERFRKNPQTTADWNIIRVLSYI